MGTFLGNLQVWNASLEAVTKQMPTALVGQWSERFVTVLEEGYGLGTVDRPAQRLSKMLPEAVVLSVGLADSDLLELAVWKSGARLTVRAHFPYDGVSRRGDPKKFCQALQLPVEDEKRLKAVWAKGDAEEQLVLTAALLGAPLYADSRMAPEKMTFRDAERVDRWLEDHPDPPKVKNRTRAEELQVLEGYSAEWSTSDHGQLRALLCRRPDGEGRYDWRDSVVLCPTLSGRLEEWEQYRPPAGLSCRISQCGDRFFVWSEREYSGRETATSTVWADSSGILPCPFSFPLDGAYRACSGFVGLEDGGLLAVLASVDAQQWPWGIIAPEELVRYTPEGEVRWRVVLRDQVENRTVELFHNGLIWLSDSENWMGLSLVDGRERACISREWDMELLDVPTGANELWAVRHCFDRERKEPNDRLMRMDLTGRVLQEESLPACLSQGLGELTVWGAHIAFCSFRRGLWLLDRDTLAVRAGIPDHREYINAVADQAGRLWVQVGNSTIEAYDRELRLLSRHRLKGGIMGWSMDGQGRLCVVTYSENKGKGNVYFDETGELCWPGFDPKKEIVRVYRLVQK